MATKNPITILGQGIKQGDWAKVCQAYTMMTGRELASPEVATVDENAGAAIAKIVEALEDGGYAWGTQTQGTESEEPDEGDGDEDDEDESEPNSRGSPEDEDDEEDEYRKRPGDRRQPTAVRRALAARAQQAAEQGEDDDEGGGQQPCRREPYKPPTGKNRFRASAAPPPDKFDKNQRYLPKRVSPRRPQATKVSVTCGACGSKFKVYPADLPVRIGADDSKSKYVCNSCIGHNIPER